MTLRLRPAVFSVTSLGISVAGPGNNLYKDPVGREFGAFKKMEKPRATGTTYYQMWKLQFGNKKEGVHNCGKHY